MVMSDTERLEYDKKLEKQKHSIKRFININISHLQESHSKDLANTNSSISRIEETQNKMFDLMLKAYQQSVETANELDKRKTEFLSINDKIETFNETNKAEFTNINTSIIDLKKEENKNEVKIDKHINKMIFYVWIIDNRKKILISAPFIIGLFLALKEPITEYIIEIIKIWA